MSKAFAEAMQDSKVIEVFAATVAKKIIEQKSKPSNDEDLFVKNHVVFAEAGDVKGTYMIAKEIEEAILAINPEFEIRTRTFGKSLLSESKEQKQTNKGRAYFIKAIVPDMKAYAAEVVVEDAEHVSEEAVEEEVEVPTTEKSGKKDKKDKKKDKKSKSEDEVAEVAELKPATPEEAFEPAVDVAQLIKATEGYDSIDDYKEHLEGMSKGKLIKHINLHKMPISCENVDEEVIVGRIIDMIEKHMTVEEEKEVEEVAETEAPTETKKEKKKDKKSKKEDKFAEIGKKDKKKKKQKKNK